MSSPSSYGTDRPHVVITGKDAAHVAGLARAIESTGTRTTVAEKRSDLHGESVTALLVVLEPVEDDNWRDWLHNETDIWDVFDDVVPHLSNPSTGLIVGYTATDDPEARSDYRLAWEDLASAFESAAISDGGVDFTMNAIEVPVRSDREVLEARLAEFFSKRRSTYANHVVVPFENLHNSSIIAELTNSVI